MHDAREPLTHRLHPSGFPVASTVDCWLGMFRSPPTHRHQYRPLPWWRLPTWRGWKFKELIVVDVNGSERSVSRLVVVNCTLGGNVVKPMHALSASTTLDLKLKMWNRRPNKIKLATDRCSTKWSKPQIAERAFFSVFCFLVRDHDIRVFVVASRQSIIGIGNSQCQCQMPMPNEKCRIRGDVLVGQSNLPQSRPIRRPLCKLAVIPIILPITAIKLSTLANVSAIERANGE